MENIVYVSPSSPWSFFEAHLRHHANELINTSLRISNFLHDHHVIMTSNKINNNALEIRPPNGGCTLHPPHPLPLSLSGDMLAVSAVPRADRADGAVLTPHH